MAGIKKIRAVVLPGQNKVSIFYDWVVFEKCLSMRAIAKELKVTPASLYFWRRIGDIPLKHLKKVDEFSGGMFPPHFFRPDLILKEKGSERIK